MEKTYNIDYGCGNYDDSGYESIEAAMEAADEAASYTQRDITIEDENGDIVAVRIWWGVAYDEEDEGCYCEDPICFGDFGFYSDWYIF